MDLISKNGYFRQEEAQREFVRTAGAFVRFLFHRFGRDAGIQKIFAVLESSQRRPTDVSISMVESALGVGIRALGVEFEEYSKAVPIIEDDECMHITRSVHGQVAVPAQTLEKRQRS